MKCHILNSGSSGNCYILTDNTGYSLIIEAGVVFPKIRAGLDSNISNCDIIVSHCHQDHNKGAKDAMKNGINVYASLHTHESMDTVNNRRARIIEAMNPFDLGRFTVMAFDVFHNVQCFGFLIQHPDAGQIVFITDSSYVDYEFPGTNTWMIEANYDKDYLFERTFDGKVNAFLAKRVMDDHMSIQDCQRILGNQDLSQAETIILLHLSASNSKGLEFKEKVIKQTGIPTHLALPNLILDISIS
jgi:phosphoribosyl 1,2-cyclic phosphodiesterase